MLPLCGLYGRNQHYERELAMAEEYEEQNRLENDSLLVNIAEQNRSYGALKSNQLLIN